MQQHQARWNGLRPVQFNASSDDWDAVVDDVKLWSNTSARSVNKQRA